MSFCALSECYFIHLSLSSAFFLSNRVKNLLPGFILGNTPLCSLTVEYCCLPSGSYFINREHVPVGAANWTFRPHPKSLITDSPINTRILLRHQVLFSSLNIFQSFSKLLHTGGCDSQNPSHFKELTRDSSLKNTLSLNFFPFLFILSAPAPELVGLLKISLTLSL